MWQNIKDFGQSIIDFLYKCLLSIFEFFKDLIWFFLDGLMAGATGLLDLTSDAFTALNPLQYISLIPAEVQGFLNLIGFNDCMSILIGAILIRFTLQLIPFVRWGS